MFRIYKIIILCLVLLLRTSSLCLAEDITNFNILIENGKNLDGTIVTVDGEAIGDIMQRGNASWLNVSDGSNAIGVWDETGILNTVTVLGNYHEKGDLVKVQGEFHRACSEHGGDMDIHLKNLCILEKGYSLSQPLDSLRLRFLGLLSLVTLLIFGIYHKFKRVRTL